MGGRGAARGGRGAAAGVRQQGRYAGRAVAFMGVVGSEAPRRPGGRGWGGRRVVAA